ncbi:MAG: class I SAM-dependent methyltransferase [Planctomycetota bacterium]
MIDPSHPGTPRLYDDLAWLWPMLSPPDHYVAEASLLNGLIVDRRGPGPKRVLELGAGGGHTLVHLAKPEAEGGPGHTCVAVDRSAPMLANCRTLIPAAETVVGDMRDVRLDQTFDAVLVHDAIDYLLTPEDARRTLATVHHHLLPGGIAFIAPTYTRETFVDGDTAHDTAPAPSYEDRGFPEVDYFSYVHDPDPADDTFEMILLYLIRRRLGPPQSAARAVEVVEDRHTCGLFAAAQWLLWLEQADLPGELIEEEGGAWSLFLGTRR